MAGGEKGGPPFKANGSLAEAFGQASRARGRAKYLGSRPPRVLLKRPDGGLVQPSDNLIAALDGRGVPTGPAGIITALSSFEATEVARVLGLARAAEEPLKDADLERIVAKLRREPELPATAIVTIPRKEPAQVDAPPFAPKTIEPAPAPVVRAEPAAATGSIVPGKEYTFGPFGRILRVFDPNDRRLSDPVNTARRTTEPNNNSRGTALVAAGAVAAGAVLVGVPLGVATYVDNQHDGKRVEVLSNREGQAAVGDSAGSGSSSRDERKLPLRVSAEQVVRLGEVNLWNATDAALKEKNGIDEDTAAATILSLDATSRAREERRLRSGETVMLSSKALGIVVDLRVHPERYPADLVLAYNKLMDGNAPGTKAEQTAFAKAWYAAQVTEGIQEVLDARYGYGKGSASTSSADGIKPVWPKPESGKPLSLFR